MASTYSDRLKLELMEAGANSGVWGNNTNENLEIIDAAIGGYLSKSVAGSANVTLTTADRDPNVETTNESANRVIDLNGTLTGNIYVFVPALEKEYTIFNNTSGAYTVTVAATGHSANGVTVTQGTYSHLYCDGSANYNIKNSVSTLGATEFKANVSLGDSNYINLGASNDLQIYHDGSHSIIADAGTGNLEFRGTHLVARNGGDTGNYFQAIDGAQIELFYSGNKKFETTSTGIDVTGKTTTDSIDAVGSQSGSTPIVKIENSVGDNLVSFKRTTGTPSDEYAIGADSTALHFKNSTLSTYIMSLNEGGNVGIGETSPSAKLEVVGDVLIPETTLTDGATISWDVSTKSVAKVTLGGNRTISAPSNAAGAGQFVSLLVIQDGTGTRTLTWNAVYEFKDDTAPTLTSTGGKGDLFVFRYNGTKWLEVGRNLNLTLS